MLPVRVGELLSETWMVKLYTLAVVGVPVIEPVVADSVSPAGRGPELDPNPHVYGARPPVAVRVAEYGSETWAPGKEVVVIANEEEFEVDDATVTLNEAVAD